MKPSLLKFLEVLPPVGLLLGTIFLVLNLMPGSAPTFFTPLVSFAFPFVTTLSYVTARSIFHLGAMSRRVNNGTKVLFTLYVLSFVAILWRLFRG